jgi:hypothetical protein
MISFSQYLTEISADPELQNLIQKKSYTGRISSKLIPNTDSFNIIPIRITYAVYDVFKRYVNPRYKLANDLLNRRGSGTNIVTVKASNEEIINLKELAEFISENASEYEPNRPEYTNQEREIAVAQSLVKEIEEIVKIQGIHNV